MKRQRPQAPAEEGAPAWMNTYGDMVTLMLTFFILLFSFSTMNEKKWQEIVQSFTGVVSMEGGGSAISVGNGSSVVPVSVNAIAGKFDMLYEQIKDHIADKGMEASLEVKRDGSTITLRMKDSVLFNSGQAVIRSESLDLVKDILAILREYKDSIKAIRIEGHTDNVPIYNGDFNGNWNLSVQRAVNVLEYVLKRFDIPPDKLSAAGFGEYHPIDTNDTAEGRARNRRVDFIIENMQ